jgi:hypothetical protein
MLPPAWQNRDFRDTAPHHQCESSFSTKNSAHFAQGRGPIGEELQAQLAIHDVE